jgi:DNA-directed RNA polymerase subunit RPC12/RpoP
MDLIIKEMYEFTDKWMKHKCDNKQNGNASEDKNINIKEYNNIKTYKYKCIKCKNEYESNFDKIIITICDPCGDIYNNYKANSIIDSDNKIDDKIENIKVNTKNENIPSRVKNKKDNKDIW